MFSALSTNKLSGSATATAPLAPVTLWCGPDESQFDSIEHRLGLVDDVHLPNRFHKGAAILQCVEYAGDHLFVDRLTYNFRRPARGEIIVFKTKDIPQIGSRTSFTSSASSACPATPSASATTAMSASTESVWTPPRRTSKTSMDLTRIRRRATAITAATSWCRISAAHLSTSADQLKVRDKHYAVFGDNTVNSADSRYWGDFPQQNIMGRAWFVYWPYSSRFGFTTRR